MAEKRTVEPTVEPVTLVEAKAQAIIETTDYDTIVNRKIRAARDWVEKYTGRALVKQTWRTTFDRFPRGKGALHGSRDDYDDARIIRLNHPPVMSVTSVSYVDTAGDSQTLAASKYVVDTDSEPARIAEATGEEWPDTYQELNDVTIVSVHGYADSSDSPLDLDVIPGTIRDAILMLFTELYEQRAVSVGQLERIAVVQAAEEMLWPYRARPIIL